MAMKFLYIYRVLQYENDFIWASFPAQRERDVTRLWRHGCVITLEFQLPAEMIQKLLGKWFPVWFLISVFTFHVWNCPQCLFFFTRRPITYYLLLRRNKQLWNKERYMSTGEWVPASLIPLLKGTISWALTFVLIYSSFGLLWNDRSFSISIYLLI